MALNHDSGKTAPAGREPLMKRAVILLCVLSFLSTAAFAVDYTYTLHSFSCQTTPNGLTATLNGDGRVQACTDWKQRVLFQVAGPTYAVYCLGQQEVVEEYMGQGRIDCDCTRSEQLLPTVLANSECQPYNGEGAGLYEVVDCV